MLELGQLFRIEIWNEWLIDNHQIVNNHNKVLLNPKADSPVYGYTFFYSAYFSHPQFNSISPKGQPGSLPKTDYWIYFIRCLSSLLRSRTYATRASSNSVDIPHIFFSEKKI